MNSFAALACRPCAASADLLLALAAEFAPAEAEETHALLDDDARRLFGIGALGAPQQAERLHEVMREELRFTLDGSGDPRSLLMPAVLRRRSGHPLALAAVAAELAERAGASAAVASSSSSWFVVLEHDGDVGLLDAGLRPAPEHVPGDLHAHCAHQLAFSTLSGLVYCYSLLALHEHARRASQLRLVLPLDGVLRAKVQREVDAYDEP